MALLFFLPALPLAILVSYFAREAAAARTALLALAGAEEKTEAMLKGWLENLSFGLYKGASGEQALVDALAARAARLDELALHSAIALAALCAVTLAAYSLAWHRSREAPARRACVRQLFAVAAVCLGVGITAPVLSVSAHTEVMFIGEVVLQHDTKDIVGTVRSLGATGNLWLALLVGLFSIALPCAKLLLSWVALDVEHPRLRELGLAMVQAIGRWSMTDVFVVALLLAFFAAQAEQLTDAATGLGLWFFAAYALLSLAGGHLLEKLAEKHSSNT